jgi:hypothetical protein
MTFATTLFTLPSITETVPLSLLATYVVFVDESAAIALGLFPIFI